MGEIINFGKEKDDKYLGHKQDVHPMLLEALYIADDGEGDSLDILDTYLVELHSGIPVTKAIARAIVRARQMSTPADILES